MISYKIGNILSTHSFNSYRVSVVEFADMEQAVKKGIAVAPVPYYLFEEAIYSEAMGNFGKPLELDDGEAQNFYLFISGILSGNIPAKILVNSRGPKLRIRINNFNENWYAGGAYKGRIGFGLFGALSFTNNAIVTRDSLSRLQESLATLFSLNIVAESSGCN